MKKTTKTAPKSTKSAKAKAAPKSAAKAKAAKEAKPKKLSALNAAAKVLADAKEPMGCKELIEAMEKKGLWTSPGGKTPHATLYSAILREITAKGKEARFKKTDRGRFAANLPASASKYGSVGARGEKSPRATRPLATFAGNVLARDLISSDGNLTIGCGRLLSATKQVTLIQDNISILCLDHGFGSSGGFNQGVGAAAVPEPGTFLIFGSLLVDLFGFRKRLFSAA